MAQQAAGQPPFTWGIVGTGTIAARFARDLALVDGAALGAVHSRSEQKGRDFAQALAIPRSCHELDRFLADPALDAVYIATPNHLHVPQALAAIAAGKPALIEKPIALTATEVGAIAEVSRKHGVFAMEAMWTRFLPAVAAARRQIADGRIGTIRRIDAELAYRREPDDSRFFDPALGGGAALDLGVYALSLTLQLLGPPERVEAGQVKASSGVDLRSDFRLHYPGAVAELSCGFDRDGGNRFLIEGSAGALRLEAPFLKAKRLTHYTPTALASPLSAPRASASFARKLLDRLPLPGRHQEQYDFPGEGLQFQAMAVMEAVRAGAWECETMPLAESAAVLRVIGAARA
ncbi:hypothetical protein ASE63_14140 [Bosea sp. Root381]|uniref:Gfo/Idh/MocA family protein n=1 Tax=Bosea sp. Root381 TaxID=1736524 RepID=UPI0007007F82|nr:Gfo/Idh/MocA family oxidoreductase [Bosea sp. Root381]KRE16860.1 hypothetical protein ASE63_14140 [Bosea sp. Root381]